MKKISERIAATASISPEYLTEYPPLPKAVKIEVTSRCDLKCFFCSVTYKKQISGDINKDFLYRLLQDLNTLGVQEVGLFWLGEPLLVKELPEYVAYAKKVGIPYVFITTNARLATEDRIRPLFESGLDSIKISINAGDREQYKKVCGIDAFEQVISNLKSLKRIRGVRRKPSIYASTVFDPNSQECYKLVHSIVEPYVDEHYPLRLYGPFSYEENIDRTQVKTKERIAERTLESMMPCWSVFNLPHISYDGHLSACFCDHDPRFYMADLNEVSFKEAWYSPKIVELRRKHLNRERRGHVCENCIAYKTPSEVLSAQKSL